MDEDSYKGNLIIYDTSFLIQLGKFNFGTEITLRSLTKQLSSEGGYTEIVPRSVWGEYTRLFEKRICQNGLPLYNHMIMQRATKGELVRDLPYMTSDQRQEIYDFWRQKSRKGPLGGWLEIADSDIITFTKMMAENGKNCYVCTYDSDISVTCSKFGEERNLPIHAVSYMRHADVPPLSSYLFLTERALRELFTIPETGKDSLRYLTLTKMNLNGRKFDVALNVGDSLQGKKLEENPVRRAPLTLLDVSDIHDIEDKSYRLSDSDIDSIVKRSEETLGHFAPFLIKSYGRFSYVIVNRSKQLGSLIFSTSKIDSRQFRNGYSSPGFAPVEYSLLVDYYMSSHHSIPYAVVMERARKFQ